MIHTKEIEFKLMSNIFRESGLSILTENAEIISELLLSEEHKNLQIDSKEVQQFEQDAKEYIFKKNKEIEEWKNKKPLEKINKSSKIYGAITIGLGILAVAANIVNLPNVMIALSLLAVISMFISTYFMVLAEEKLIIYVKNIDVILDNLKNIKSKCKRGDIKDKITLIESKLLSFKNKYNTEDDYKKERTIINNLRTVEGGLKKTKYATDLVGSKLKAMNS